MSVPDAREALAKNWQCFGKTLHSHGLLDACAPGDGHCPQLVHSSAKNRIGQPNRYQTFAA